MPVRAWWREAPLRCHSAQSSRKRAWATPAQSDPSGATLPASWRRVPSMEDAPASSWAEICWSCSGVTRMPVAAMVLLLLPRWWVGAVLRSGKTAAKRLSTAPWARSVVDRLDPPAAAGQPEQVGGALVGGGLEADQAAVGGRVPPALVDQPGTGPGGDGRPGAAADPDPARQRAEQAAAVDSDAGAGGVDHLHRERLRVHDRRGGGRHLPGPGPGPGSGGRALARALAGGSGGVERKGAGQAGSARQAGNIGNLGARPAATRQPGSTGNRNGAGVRSGRANGAGK